MYPSVHAHCSVTLLERETVSKRASHQRREFHRSQLASIPKNICGHGSQYFCPENNLSQALRELHDRKGKPEPVLVMDKRWQETKSQLPEGLSRAFCKEEPRQGKDPDHSQTLITVVSPLLPACRVGLPRCVVWWSLHRACCP